MADWSNAELTAAVNDATRISAAATAKRLAAAVEEEVAINRLMEIESELTIRRRIFRKPDPDQMDHDEFIEEMSLGGKIYQER